MNRRDRRNLKKRMKGENIFLEKGVEVEDHSRNEWCWRCKPILEDIDNPTEKDKKKLAKIRMVPTKAIDKNGKISYSRTCLKCFTTVPIAESLEGAKVDGYTLR